MDVPRKEGKKFSSYFALQKKTGVVCHLGHIFKISAAAGHEYFIPLKIRVLGFKLVLISKIQESLLVKTLRNRVFHIKGGNWALKMKWKCFDLWANPLAETFKRGIMLTTPFLITLSYAFHHCVQKYQNFSKSRR